MQTSLTPIATRLVARLHAAKPSHTTDDHVYHVASIGTAFYFAYEQLRNVAEYQERHLLLRSAIERFLVRNLSLRRYQPIAADLVTELTQSGYLKNDSIPMNRLGQIDDVLSMHSQTFITLTDEHGIDHHQASKWILQYTSVKIENILNPDHQTSHFMQFAFEHYLEAIDSQATEQVDSTDQEYRIALFCAVQRSLFKSNLATIRYYCIEASLGGFTYQPMSHVIQLNQLIDVLYQAPIANRLARLITRHGAPLRILRELIMTGDTVKHLADHRAETLSKVKSICSQQYALVRSQLNSRIAKTILFVLVTKTLIGVSIEVPYDLAVGGAIAWLPLALNICFPVIYMALIAARIQTPSHQNTEVIANYIDRILYQSTGAPVVYRPKRRVKSRSLNAIFTFIYTIGFVGSVSLLIWLLHRLEFNIVNGAIFFLFFSAVSFLGFRLRSATQELQMLDERQGFFQTVIDFLSAPFVRVGHWLSDKYAKTNIVTFVLDMAIEMPLKTSLRFVQQWISFLRDKQEEL